MMLRVRAAKTSPSITAHRARGRLRTSAVDFTEPPYDACTAFSPLAPGRFPTTTSLRVRADYVVCISREARAAHDFCDSRWPPRQESAPSDSAAWNAASAISLNIGEPFESLRLCGS